MNQQTYPFKTNINDFTAEEVEILKSCGISPIEKYLNLKDPFIFDYSKLHTLDNRFLHFICSNIDISFLFSFIDWGYMFLFGNATLKTTFEEYQFINKRSDYTTKFSNFCCIYDNLIWHGSQYNLPNEMKVKHSHYDNSNFSYYQGKHYHLIVNFIDVFLISLIFLLLIILLKIIAKNFVITSLYMQLMNMKKIQTPILYIIKQNV